MRWTLAPLILFLSVLAHAYVSITTSSLPNSTVGARYSATIEAPGGCTPYTWKISSGALAPGLALSGLSTKTYATISGNPSAAGSYSFAVWVKGCGGHTSTHAYTVTIANPSISVSISPTSATVVVGQTRQFTAIVSGTGNTAVTWSLGGVGTVSSSGLYTAPGSAGTAAVTATSQANPTKSASAAVTVEASIQHSVSLSWTETTRGCTFNAYRSTTSGGPYARIQAGIAGLSYVDQTVQSGQTYYYATTCVASGVESAMSQSVQAVIPFP